MIFKSKENSLSVYDPKTESFIAEFKKGNFETNDEKLIARLKEMGYESDEIVEEKVEKKVEKKVRQKKEKVSE
jgi:basic membrane lipoprotein Med (substrate-binding protein (PBP1-ABC) superfamily)